MYVSRQLLRKRTHTCRLVILFSLLIAVIVATGCGAGGASTTPTPPPATPPPPPPPGVTHSVTLTWKASTSPQVTGYFVYRRPTSSATYVLLNQSPTASLTYVDLNVQAGQNLAYSVTAVDSSLTQSPPTPDVLVTIPQ